MEMLGPMLGAGGAIGGALIGQQAQHESSVTNYMIAMLNYYQRQREQFDAKQEAQRVEHKSDEGFTDSLGNSTKFIPGKGWVSTLSPQSAALQGRENNERMLSLGHDATIKRQQLDKNSERSTQEGDYANALMDQMRRTPKTNPDALERTLYGAQAQGINRGYDDTIGSVAKQALRSRSSNAGEMIKDIGRQRSDALGDAAMNARSSAISMAPQIDSSKRSSDANLYNMFATRASAMPDVSFAPSGVAENANANLGTAAKLGQTGQNFGFLAASSEGPRFPYQPPNYGAANSVGAIGTSLGNAFQQNQQQGNYNALLDEIRKTTRGNSGDFIE